MNNTDEKILRLIDLLKFEKKISTTKDFCIEISMYEQSISKIKKGENHFTVSQIESICKVYNVNANWIFGLDKKVYNSKNSIEI
ncbi:helix-turn-helix domain-containing protein [uncultured Flavobacterium sp.]|uniref:helix-turn-helix domain-containing protein n=1 Tax=uncultured Flavobacterium sp. TaxID=165435 RepID=UPI0030EEC6DA|tara:strand:- start:2740 stop:2991 length:252 start_codon:yes stop_codon:yes gene_type:complete